MPFTFIDIEERKSRIIGFLFVFIVGFYFLTAFLVLLVLENSLPGLFASSPSSPGFHLPLPHHVLVAFLVASMAGLIHWTVSTSNLIPRISLAVGAQPLDDKDAYHQVFKNIVAEVSVAIGGRPLEALVVPSAGMNAFALEDFNRRAVIGVTEGLLSRLNRSQIEAVVGHEAGHITSGDCLSTTVTCALAEIYEATLDKLRAGFRGSRGRGAGLLVLLYFVIGFMSFMSKFIRAFISRQREYRADAVSVRLTRDPLSLAEALALISTSWRGAGTPESRMESIYIVNPSWSSLDETDGFFADMFSTHPPVKNRVGVLAGLAHLDERTIEENLKNFKRVAPVAAAEIETPEAQAPRQWSVFLDQQWLGPFSLEGLRSLEGFKPESWVRPLGSDAAKHAYEDARLLDVFKAEGAEEKEKFQCPHCRAPLAELTYEGAPVLRCAYCQGVFTEEDKISRLLIRQDKQFSGEALRLAEVVMKEKEKFAAGREKFKMKNAWVLDCPKCGRKMRRQFFVYSYPVEIDRCVYCGGIWFDAFELEVLQYVYEHKEKFFDGGAF